MMGNLFSRGVSPAEIESMRLGRLKYWNEWHKIMVKEEEDQIARTKKRAAEGKK